MEAQAMIALAMVLPVGSLFSSADSTEARTVCFIASNRSLNEYNRVSFLHAILCYHKSTDSVMFSIDFVVMSVYQEYAEAVEFHRD